MSLARSPIEMSLTKLARKQFKILSIELMLLLDSKEEDLEVEEEAELALSIEQSTTGASITPTLIQITVSMTELVMKIFKSRKMLSRRSRIRSQMAWETTKTTARETTE